MKIASSLFRACVASALVVQSEALTTSSSSLSTTCKDAMTVASGRSLDGQVIVMTGGDTGLGLETTKALATTNATVVIGAYNLTHGQAVASDVAAASGNPNIAAIHIDLTNFSSIRQFAREVLEAHNSSGGIAALINDAGIGDVSPAEPVLTGDGFEQVFQVRPGAVLQLSVCCPVSNW